MEELKRKGEKNAKEKNTPIHGFEQRESVQNHEDGESFYSEEGFLPRRREGATVVANAKKRRDQPRRKRKKREGKIFKATKWS